MRIIAVELEYKLTSALSLSLNLPFWLLINVTLDFSRPVKPKNNLHFQYSRVISEANVFM
jgi:hypothetical protein